MKAVTKEMPALRAEDLDPDPIRQFGLWYSNAEKRGQDVVEACCLATATPEGAPSGRVVLLKDFGPQGFTIFTNYASRKATELEANPRASLTFYWPAVNRQVRVEGSVERIDRQESQRYFDNRPYESRLAAWASRQSSPLADRGVLDERMVELRQQYPEGGGVPLPPFWGGYRIIPARIEFWQHGPNRLHDRFRYEFTGAAWTSQRLNP